jgi:hypothetical protein
MRHGFVETAHGNLKGHPGGQFLHLKFLQANNTINQTKQGQTNPPLILGRTILDDAEAPSHNSKLHARLVF